MKTVEARSGKPPEVEGEPLQSASKKSAREALLFIGQRLGFGILVVLFIIFLSYMGLEMSGGDELGEAFKNAFPKTLTYVGRVLAGDFGVTTAGSRTLNPVPVMDVLRERLPRSLGLLGLALLLASVVGGGLGLVAARGKSSRSLPILLSTLIGVSIPSFFAAFLLQWAVTALTRQVGRAVLPVGGFGWDKHLIMPVIVLAARPIAQITRITFVTIRDVLHQEYVRTARGKGLFPRQVTFIHVIRNAAIPILTTIGVSLRYSLSSLPVVEYYFGWPGVGFTLLKGIAQQDANLTVALSACLGALFILINLALELAYRLIDPRLLQSQSQIALHERKKLADRAKDTWIVVLDSINNNAVTTWIKRRRAPQGEQSLAGTIPIPGSLEEELPGTHHRRPLYKIILGNVPFVVGSLMVVGILFVILFGPQLTPEDPYRTLGLVEIDGELTVPPFPPGDEFAWGTDILGRGMLSLLLAGARQTLILGILAVAARTLVGVVLGGVAGWTSGSRLDRLILGLAEVISAFPTLLLAMILVLGFGIRKGMSSFIIALCFVGWGEIMQFVRSQVIGIRPEPFIESAVAVGARTPRIFGKHILPNLLSSLISVVALEMGGVLMLLGELGFIGIFLGGGTRINLATGTFRYCDVPEWGALLSDIRYQARSYPWTGLYPMLAFFVAIVGFNLFGEGLRRLVEEAGVILNRIVNRYTVVVAAAAVVGLYWVTSNGAGVPYYKQHAEIVDGQRAMQHVSQLTAPDMQGRSLGSAGIGRAAEYIAEQFEALGLQAGGLRGSYFQEREHAFEWLQATPILEILDGGRTLLHGQDFAPFTGLNASMGETRARVRLLAVGEMSPVSLGVWRVTYPELYNAEFPGEILLALDAPTARLVAHKAMEGMLVVQEDPAELAKRFTLSGRSRAPIGDTLPQYIRYDVPSLWITEEVADRLLAASGSSLENARKAVGELGYEEVLQELLDVEVHMQVEGTIEKDFPVQNVIGYLSGAEGFDYCTDCLGKKLIVVMVQYDSPPVGPDGIVYPAANDNASGVAVMLEAIRAIQETDYRPLKSMMFIAYSGEGLDNGEPVPESPDVRRFLQARAGFASLFDVEAIIQLRGVGGGTGSRLEIGAGGSLRLAELFERAAKQVGAKTVRSHEGIDIGDIYEEGASASAHGQEAPLLRMFWQGWEEYSHLSTDTIQIVSSDNLEVSGRTLALALMVLGRETEY